MILPPTSEISHHHKVTNITVTNEDDDTDLSNYQNKRTEMRTRPDTITERPSQITQIWKR